MSDKSCDLYLAWNQRLTNKLKQLSVKAETYKHLHELCASEKHITNKKLSITKLIIFAFIGVTTTSEVMTLLNDLSNSTVGDIITTSVQTALYVIYSILKIVIEGNDYHKKIDVHRQTAFKFGNIAMTIQHQLCLPISKRDSDNNFLETQMKMYNECKLNMPFLGGKDTNVNMLRRMTCGNIFKPNSLDFEENDDADDRVMPITPSINISNSKPINV